MIYGGIEAGGTKFVYGIGDNQGNIIEKFSCPTLTPQETFPQIIEYFKSKKITALGIGSFGPIELDPHSPKYGYITSTPKPSWSNTEFSPYFQRELNIPTFFNTDVNAAALGELTWGIAQGLSGCLYLTIGTGIGGGLIINHKIIQGFSHPEMGHIHISKHPDDKYEGYCPYHKNCFEGLASGPSLYDRWKIKGNELPIDHPAWKIEAYYIAQAILNFIYTIAPEKIVLGGGVMHQPHLLPLIHKEIINLLQNYISHPLLSTNIHEYIVTPKLGDNAGLIGAITLGINA